jgi:hypothetical protein
VLDVSLDGHPMGSEPVLSGPPTLRARILGTAPIDSVEVRRGTDTVYVYDALPEPASDDPYRVRLAWRGARNRGRTRALNWTGSATVSNGRITNAVNYAIDSPLDGVSDWDAGQVWWNSHTCGDWDGVILDIDGDEQTTIAIDTPTLHTRLSLGDLRQRPIEQRGEYLEQQLIVRQLAAREGSRAVTIEWTDAEPAPGWNPYWIWVTQSDGELAWSTPVYARWHH